MIHFYDGLNTINKDSRAHEVLQRALDGDGEVDFHGVYIADIMDLFSDAYGFSAAVDYDVIAPEGSPDPDSYFFDGYIDHEGLQRVSLEQALSTLFEPYGLAISTEGDTITITTTDVIERAAQRSKKGKALEAIAELELARWGDLKKFDELSSKIVELKKENDIPLTLTEQAQESREEEPENEPQSEMVAEPISEADSVSIDMDDGQINLRNVHADALDVSKDFTDDVTAIMEIDGQEISFDGVSATYAPEVIEEGEAESPGDGAAVDDHELLGASGTYTPPYLHNPDLPADEDPLRKLVNIDFKDMDLANVVALLAQKGKMNVIAGTEVEGTVTVSWTDIPLGQAIERALDMNDLGIVEESGVYRIVTAEESKTIREEPARGEYSRGFTLFNKDMAEKDDPLRQLVNIDFKDMELVNVLEQLAKKGKIALEMEGVKGSITANLKNIPLGRAIEIILRMNGLGVVRKYDGFRTKWHVVPYEEADGQRRKKLITPEPEEQESAESHDEQIVKVAAQEASSSTSDSLENVAVGGSIRVRKSSLVPSEKLLTVLEQDVDLVFENTHLSEIADRLAENYGIMFQIAPNAVAPVGSESVLGFHSDGLIEYINLKGVSMRAALEAMLQPMGLTTGFSWRYHHHHLSRRGRVVA